MKQLNSRKLNLIGLNIIPMVINMELSGGGSAPPAPQIGKYICKGGRAYRLKSGGYYIVKQANT